MVAILSKENFVYWFRFVVGKGVNALIFYVAWLLCIVFAAREDPWWGISLTLLLIFFQFAISECFWKDVILFFSLIFVGFCVDTAYIHFGWVDFRSPNPISSSLAPLWILLIWGVFGLSLNHSMWWLKQRYFLAALLGAWGGVASYVAGERLGAAVFLHSYLFTVVVLAVVWFFLLPLIFAYAVWLDRIFDEKELNSKDGKNC